MITGEIELDPGEVVIVPPIKYLHIFVYRPILLSFIAIFIFIFFVPIGPIEERATLACGMTIFSLILLTLLTIPKYYSIRDRNSTTVLRYSERKLTRDNETITDIVISQTGLLRYFNLFLLSIKINDGQRSRNEAIGIYSEELLNNLFDAYLKNKLSKQNPIVKVYPSDSSYPIMPITKI